MKQTLKIGGVLLLALTLGMWISMSQINKKKEHLQARLTEQEQMVFQKEIAMNEMLQLIESVEGQMDEIVQREQLMTTINETNVTERDEKLRLNLEKIDALVIRSKEDLAELQKRERQSELKLGLFEKRIANLNTQLKEKETALHGLKTVLEEKEAILLQVQGERADLQQALDTQQVLMKTQHEQLKNIQAENKKLYKSYLAIGTYHELKDKGLVQKEGGFLGIFGKKINLTVETPSQHFMEVDRREMHKLRIEAIALELVSKHPSDSYQIVRGKNETESILEIIDHEAFWKWSKRLVISKNT